MKKLKNPFFDLEGYNCFVCSPDNPVGLHLDFYLDGEMIKASWKPEDQYQGYPNVLHGGIQATMMDEIASWVVLVKMDTSGVTYRLNTKYREPVRISRGSITLRARVLERRRNIATISVKLMDGDGKVCSEGTADYFIFPRERAVAEFYYPGRKAFFK